MKFGQPDTTLSSSGSDSTRTATATRSDSSPTRSASRHRLTSGIPTADDGRSDQRPNQPPKVSGLARSSKSGSDRRKKARSDPGTR